MYVGFTGRFDVAKQTAQSSVLRHTIWGERTTSRRPKLHRKVGVETSRGFEIRLSVRVIALKFFIYVWPELCEYTTNNHQPSVTIGAPVFLPLSYPAVTFTHKSTGLMCFPLLFRFALDNVFFSRITAWQRHCLDVCLEPLYHVQVK